MVAKREDPQLERIRELEIRLQEAEETLNAIRSGEVDAFVASGPDGEVVYTLQGADEGYRLFLEQMAEGALTLATDGLILFTNQQFAKMLDVPAERMIGSYLSDLVTPGDRGLLGALLSECDRVQAELHLKREDGSLIPALLSGNRLRRQGADCIAVIVTDLRERRRNAEIVEAGRLAQAILEQAAVPILVVDPQGRIIQASRAAEQFAGTSVLLREFNTIFSPGQSSEAEGLRFAEILSTLEHAGNIAGQQAMLRTPNGRSADVLINAALLTGSDSQILGCVIVLVDTTERKRLEKELFEKQKLESIGLLAGGVAHDFNNLLVGILGNASLSQDMVPEGSALAQPLEQIVKCSQAAADLTRQMLAYSGRGQFIIEPVDLTASVRETMKLINSSIPGNVALHFELDPKLAPVEADAGQIQQVIMNLVLNAVEAIGDTSGVVWVRAQSRAVDQRYIHEELAEAPIEPGAYVILEVRDSGCGMDDAVRSRIFDPFFTTKFTGRGLGLAAVSGIVRGHKGIIHVTSSPNNGSSFTVYFPAASGTPRQLPETQPAVDPLGGSGTVLVVDDEEVVLQTAKLALERYGYTVLTASSGRTAIETLKRERDRVSVVLLDSAMPEMSGRDTLRELLKIQPDLEVLVSSGYAEAETMRLFAGWRVLGFVQKPYTPSRLARQVKAALGGR
jgi:two-component system, cell cycle sensor histidine kinase and response regulator CckA